MPSLRTPCGIACVCRGCRMPSLRTSCSIACVCRGCRLMSPRTPCILLFVCRGCRMPSPRTPCSIACGCRGCRLTSLRTPCILLVVCRGRRMPSLRTPCSTVLVCRGCISAFLSLGFLSLGFHPVQVHCAHASVSFRSSQHFSMPIRYLTDHECSALPILHGSRSGLLRRLTRQHIVHALFAPAPAASGANGDITTDSRPFMHRNDKGFAIVIVSLFHVLCIFENGPPHANLFVGTFPQNDPRHACLSPLVAKAAAQFRFGNGSRPDAAYRLS